MSTIRRIASRIDDALDHGKMYLRRIKGFDDPVTVHVHRGFGTDQVLHIAGTVVEKDDDAPRGSRLALLDDIRATIDRYIERGVMGARVTAHAAEASAEATTDTDGFFHAELAAEPTGAETVEWREVTVRLESLPGGKPADQDFTGEVMVPPPRARFGIISDMDDTVLKTGIHDVRRNWRQIIQSDPELREAFPGLPELYQGLTHDESGRQRNPVFYVSSAAWGFYELFVEFLRHRQVPMGPLFLKNYGLDEDKWFTGGHSGHKTSTIERLFRTYPDLPFILVGDSGQHDAMIYRDIVRRHPGRVRAVWIRDVTEGPDRSAEIEALMEEVENTGVRAAFGPDLMVAARQAAGEGWIPESAVAPVERAVEKARAS